MNSTIKLSFTLVSLITLSIFIVMSFSLNFYGSSKVFDLSPVQIDFESHESSEDIEEFEFEFIPNKTVYSYYLIQNPIYIFVSSLFQTLRGFHQIIIIPPIF